MRKQALVLLAAVFILGGCNEKSPKYFFCPQKDITAYEISILIGFIDKSSGNNKLDEMLERHPEVRRHLSGSPCKEWK